MLATLSIQRRLLILTLAPIVVPLLVMALALDIASRLNGHLEELFRSASSRPWSMPMRSTWSMLCTTIAPG